MNVTLEDGLLNYVHAVTKNQTSLFVYKYDMKLFAWIPQWRFLNCTPFPLPMQAVI